MYQPWRKGGNKGEKVKDLLHTTVRYFQSNNLVSASLISASPCPHVHMRGFLLINKATAKKTFSTISILIENKVFISIYLHID